MMLIILFTLTFIGLVYLAVSPPVFRGIGAESISLALTNLHTVTNMSELHTLVEMKCKNEC